MLIIILTILIKFVGVRRIEQALYRNNLIHGNKKNKEEQDLHKIAEKLILNKRKKR